MNSWRTIHDYRIFQVLSGRSNAFLISKSGQHILVDTGTSGSYDKMMRRIESLKEPDSKTDLLILTHAHYDHCANAAVIKEKEHCSIIAAAKEKDFAEAGFTPLPKGTKRITSFISRLGNRMDKRRFSYKPFTPDILVEEAYDLKPPGLDIQLMLTEGHSAGSVSVIVDHEIAIVGDAMFGVFPGSVIPPFADDTTAMIRSWQKLLASGCHTFLPGHGSAISRTLLNKVYNKYAGSKV